MSFRDELTRLAARDLALLDETKRRDVDPSLSPPSLLARTTTIATYPTAAQVFYACQPLQILGTEVEGAGGLVSVSNSNFFALNLGGTIPPPGTQILTTFVGNRWVFRYDA